MKEMSKVLIILSSVLSLALCFCGDHALHGNLAESAVQVSNWLREFHYGNVTRLEPHVTSAMIVSLRLVGHLPHTIINDFKTNDSYTIINHLTSYLDKHFKQHKSLSKIKPGRIASIFQAVSALCIDPQNFNGHNLTQALLEGFNSQMISTCKNYFEYSSVALAVCQSLATKNQTSLARSVLNETNKARGQITQKFFKNPDSLAMILMALSCLRRNIPENEVELLDDVNTTISKYLGNVINALKRPEDRRWNVQSKGLIVQAFVSLPKELRQKHWHCNRLLSAILEKHDPRRAFGNILANIQILPALLGRSLVDVNTSCKTHDDLDSQVKTNKIITVYIKLDPANKRSPPDEVKLVVPEKTTAFDILKLAAEKNDAYKFEPQHTSYGRMITAISGIKQNPTTGHYWALYASESLLASDGVDIFTPENNTWVIFKYEKCSSPEDTNTMNK